LATTSLNKICATGKLEIFPAKQIPCLWYVCRIVPDQI